MKHKTLKLCVLFVFCLGLTGLNAQTFTGLNYVKKAFEWEGQRYLMDEIYDITSSEFDKLRIETALRETDWNEGFVFLLTLYSFNEKTGVVITSLNTSLGNKYDFVNVHLTHEEFIDLNNKFIFLSNMLLNKDEHLLKKFNDRIVLDVLKGADPILTLWIDNYSRHTFDYNKWFFGYQEYEKFLRSLK